MMNDPLRKSLDERLADVPLEMPPPRNLWPGIAARLQRAPRRARPALFAAAAGLAGACAASALTWAVLHGRPAAPAMQMAVRAPMFGELRNPRYVAARDSLEMNFRERLTLLDPATRAHIETSLAAIRQAHEDIRKALASDPASPVLEQLWQSTWHDELDLYEHVVQATQPTMTRT
ncbi:MAG TPA: hypothetical protein VGO37_12075 [Steroidobacteraceae bacterium]|jgi:hypothetical protein|nr:hypothetical protein [Steroidobacteraceae bacterium]